MTDIVIRARAIAEEGDHYADGWAKVADEIERLREALTIIGGLKVTEFNQSNYTHYDVCELHENAVQAAEVARAALGEDA